jgi:hypothetical protein
MVVVDTREISDSVLMSHQGARECHNIIKLKVSEFVEII